MPLLLSECSLSLGYKAPVNQFNLICFYHMLFLQVSLDEYTGNHHTNTFSLFFLFLTFENGSFPTSRTNFPFINHLRLPFITLFFCPFNALQWHKADVIIPDTKPHIIVTVVWRKRNFHSWDNSQLLKLESLYEWILQSFTSTC